MALQEIVTHVVDKTTQTYILGEFDHQIMVIGSNEVTSPDRAPGCFLYPLPNQTPVK